jgi:penicillin-binding protein 1C
MILKKKPVLYWTAAAVLFGLLTLWLPLDIGKFSPQNVHSVKVFDRHGSLLREFLNDEQGRGEWVPLTSISSSLIDATIIVEDHRFYAHPGIDPASIVRAVGEHLSGANRRSGASTITQQVIRNVYFHPRTLPYKLLEAWYALRLERMMDKNAILEQYLNRAPYGNQLFGIQAASKYYFDKPAAQLTIAEAAFLAGLPNAPTTLNPRLHYARARERQRRILEKLLSEQKISQEEFRRAVVQPIPLVLPQNKFKAPHAVEMVYAHLRSTPDLSSVQTTIDGAVQNDVQWIIKGHLEHLRGKNVNNAAVVILDNRTGEVRTLIGSADYFNDAIRGKFNGTLAQRQPGSSVKIFTYGTALESGFTPASLLADIPTSIPNEGGDYVPENYDREYHGPVLLRTALACSYNIPAVRLLHSIGVDALFQRMQRAGITTLKESPKHYGVGLTLGNAEVTLLELTNAYRAVANKGILSPMKLAGSVMSVSGNLIETAPMPMELIAPAVIFTPETAFLLTSILSDHSARRPAFGTNFNFSFPCAVKTGTTKDYKDNWTLGYTTEYTVGVWVGNFDGAPMRKVSGVSGAGQIFTDIMNLLAVKYNTPGGEFAQPPAIVTAVVCSRSGMRKGPYCDKGRIEVFLPGTAPSANCPVHKMFLVRGMDGVPSKKVYEIFPEEYAEWVRSEEIPQPSSRAMEYDGRTVPELERKDFAIVFPHSGDVFKIDPVLRKEYQKVKVATTVPQSIGKVKLKVNDSTEISYSPIRDAWIPLTKGKNTIQLTGIYRGKPVVSTAIKFYVE